MITNDLYRPRTVNTLTDKPLATVKYSDQDRPFTYKEWLARTTCIRSGFEREEYNKYLVSWAKAKENNSTITEKIKSDYIGFIRAVSKFFSEDDKRKFDESFDLNDYLNLEQIIPYCAERLCDIMKYYIDKRNTIRDAKLRYNLNGTERAVERMLYRQILKAFTKHGQYIKINDPALYNTLPELSAVNNKLEIKIDELYDDNSYFDKDPENTTINIPSGESLAFYEGLGYGKDELDWLFSCGFNGVVANNAFSEIADDSLDTELNDYDRFLQKYGAEEDAPLSGFTDFDRSNTIEYFQRELTKKYLGEDLYAVSGGYFTNRYYDINLPLVVGNNWIYYPSGEADFESPEVTLEPLYLSGSNLLENEFAIGSDNYANADKIFIQYGSKIEGAWLKDTTETTTPSTMVCNVFANKPFTFRFPYCGYGLSGEGVDWSGAGIDNTDQTFYTLSDEERKAILSSYWNTDIDISCDPIKLQNTSLAKCGAVAAPFYADADRISVRTSEGINDDNPNGVYTDAIDRAYLYKMTETDFPVMPGKNYITWPIQNVTVDGSVSVPNGMCESKKLCDVDTTKLFGSRAGYGLFDSDIIYKLDAPNGNPIECAFLKGTPFTNFTAVEELGWTNTSWVDQATGCFQVGQYLHCEPNAYCTFMWLDEDTPMDDVVFHIEHQPDCPYLKEKKYSLYGQNPYNQPEDSKITFKEWQKCTCGAIRYSPLGHPGEKFDDYKGFADFCFADTLYPLPFSKSTWESVARNGRSQNYKTSDDFGWYQLDKKVDQVEPDVGWGKGHWVAKGDTNGGQFILRKGVQYKYYRHNLGYNEIDIIDGKIAPIVITHKTRKETLKYTKPVWMKAIADEEGNWQPTEKKTDMVIEANDTIVYDHIDTNWYCITAVGNYQEWDEEVNIVPYNDAKSTPFTQYDVVPVSSYIASVKWPKKPNAKLEPSFPLSNELTYVKWEVELPEMDTFTKILPVGEPLSVASMYSGMCHIACTGFSGDAKTTVAGSGAVSGAQYNKISINFKPPVLKHLSGGSNLVETVKEDTIGFPFNTELYGWDYDRNSERIPETSAHGARPFWGVASEDDGIDTRSKSMPVWGGNLRLVEDYVPIRQPLVSDIDINAFACVTYETSKPFVWEQPLDMHIENRDRRWCKLQIDTTKPHVLSGELSDPTFRNMISVATEDTSDMYFVPRRENEQVLINYWANENFTWEDRVKDISKGVAPTGGDYVPSAMQKMVDAKYEYANLSNRHYPTVAVAPIVDGFYRKEDVGGYVIPQYLGVSTTVAKNVKMGLNATERTEDDNTSYITDMNVYAKEYGLSETSQNAFIDVVSDDSTWMKSSMSNGVNAGFIVNPVRNQQMISYQTNAESNLVDEYGIMRPDDLRDPWKGEKDTDWMTEMFDEHFTGQDPIAYVRSMLWSVKTAMDGVSLKKRTKKDTETIRLQLNEIINALSKFYSSFDPDTDSLSEWPASTQINTRMTDIRNKIYAIIDKVGNEFKVPMGKNVDISSTTAVIDTVSKLLRNIEWMYSAKIKHVDDLYGYSYGLVKDASKEKEGGSRINAERLNSGNIYVRKNDGLVDDLRNLLPALMYKEDTNPHGIKDNEVVDIMIHNDVLYVLCADKVLIYKLTYEPDRKDGYNVLNASVNSKTIHFAENERINNWVYPEDKILCVIVTRYDNSEMKFFVHNINENTFIDSIDEYDVGEISGVSFDMEKVIGPFISCNQNGIICSATQVKSDAKVGKFVVAKLNTKEKTANVRVVDGNVG